MKRAIIALVLTLAFVGIPAAQAEMPSRVLLLSGLGYSNPDTAFETWVGILGQTAIVGKPNLKVTSFTAYAALVKAEIREAYEKSNHQKIGVIAQSIAATAVFDAILKDKAIRETMVSRAVLISPLVSGIDADAHDIAGVLTYTGMSDKLKPTFEKGSNYFASLYTLIKNTSARIQGDPTLMNKYPRILIVTSKDDGLIPMSASNPTILQFVLSNARVVNALFLGIIFGVGFGLTGTSINLTSWKFTLISVAFIAVLAVFTLLLSRLMSTERVVLTSKG